MCCMKKLFFEFQEHKENIELAVDLSIYSSGIGIQHWSQYEVRT